MEIIFATSNPHKVREVGAILGENFKLILPSELGITEDIPETGSTLEENALQKCLYIWNRLHKPVFSDDSGLEVDCLNGAPGIHTARYAGEDKDPEKNIDKLLATLEGVKNRKARFRTAIAYIDANGEHHITEGIMPGEIALRREGSGGFGYDPVFIPQGHGGLTFAQLGVDVKNRISHRSQAVAKFTDFLRKANSGQHV